MMNKQSRYSFRDFLIEELKDPLFRKAYEEADLPVRLAIEIAKLREREGLTQADVARKLGTTQQVISRIEKCNQNNLTVGTLQKIAKALNATLHVEFVRDGSERPNAGSGARAAPAGRRRPRRRRP